MSFLSDWYRDLRARFVSAFEPVNEFDDRPSLAEVWNHVRWAVGMFAVLVAANMGYRALQEPGRQERVRAKAAFDSIMAPKLRERERRAIYEATRETRAHDLVRKQIGDPKARVLSSRVSNARHDVFCGRVVFETIDGHLSSARWIADDTSAFIESSRDEVGMDVAWMRRCSL